MTQQNLHQCGQELLEELALEQKVEIIHDLK